MIMFKWFWTIFSSGTPEKFLGNICSFEQLFYSKKSLGASERESEPRSCEERESVSHSPRRFTALSLFREENLKKNLWNYGTLRIAHWMTHQWILGLDSHTVLYEPRHERVMAGVWENLWLKYFGPTDTLRKWYISKELGAEPYHMV